MFERQCFSPIAFNNEREEEGEDYLRHGRHRRQLLQNLLQLRRKSRKHCFHLPNRYFSFLPISPCSNGDDDSDSDNMMFEDPPPLMFECDSFCLTSTGDGTEFLLLDPFDGSLSLFPNVVQNAVASTEGMMEQAMLEAAHAIRHKDELSYMDWQEEHIAGEVIDESIYRNHTRHEYPSSPSQSLLTPDDYFAFPVGDYFPDMPQPRPIGEEFEMAYVGVDSKPIMRDGKIEGNMIGVGRCVRNDAILRGEELVCTELTAWFKTNQEAHYTERRVCRFPWTFHYVDLDPIYKRLYVSFYPRDGPTLANPDTDRPPPLGRFSYSFGRSAIAVYPMILHTDGLEGEDQHKYFPEPIFWIRCEHPISSFSIDPTGSILMVATIRGTLELWQVKEAPARLISRLLIRGCLQRSIGQLFMKYKNSSLLDSTATRRSSAMRGMEMVFSVQDQISGETNSLGRPPDSEPFPFLADGSEGGLLNDNSDFLFVLRRQSDLERLRVPVDSFFLSRHLSIDKCGFVTLQHSSEEGSSLLLWRLEKGQWETVSIINLPLSSRRMPRVFFDGTRLIVYGEDHIGIIILLYHVLNSNEDITLFDLKSGEEASGGVYNLTDPPRVRFAHRVRHVALGGIESMDSIHLTCNERFVVVNTKTGNLLGEGTSPFSEGLLVIDLQDRT